ncbi:MAG TPA: ion transporter [Saprospiraceae bacterium]|nr:ion transporter [Saprospiraceae bacterium]MCB9269018.1 ion transporter [Lewinellaceae bacterium]HPG08061.1 ion transporter [Saprospiraceae bacterium]HPQ99746.1 ion transporter [Saprospiraceae bacterium]HRV84798.1 ion transporter [Saprospiraceae bacterium]
MTEHSNLLVRLFHRIGKFLLFVGNRGRKFLDRFISVKGQERLHRIIFESNTKEGRRFDTILIIAIAFSVLAIIFETVSSFHHTYWWLFYSLEWFFTVIFTVEYVLRLYASRNPVAYATSFFGFVDLLAILPAYIGIFFPGAQHLLIIRVLRLLRIFRIFKMGHFVREGSIVVGALQASRTKIYVFLSFVVLMAVLLGTLMYMVEGDINPEIRSIPDGIYWAIVTLTTVGYGDKIPITAPGQMLATVVMILGYGVIAVPTGIVTAEISGRVMNLKEFHYFKCPQCGQTEHHKLAQYCHRCGHSLSSPEENTY